MKYLSLFFIFFTSALAQGEPEKPFQGKAIALTVFNFIPESRIFSFNISYTDNRAIIPSPDRKVKGIEIMDSRGRLLKNTFLSLGKCCYELHSGNGTFTLNLLLQDQFFPKDGRLHIKGNAILACARLDALPVQEIILQQGASYSIPLYIPPFAETGNDIANPATLPSVDIRFHKSKKENTWTIGLNHPVNFPYAGMEFFDQQNQKIPVTIEPSLFRSGPPTFNPYTCSFPRSYDRVRLKIQYKQDWKSRTMPLDFTINADGLLESKNPPMEK